MKYLPLLALLWATSALGQNVQIPPPAHALVGVQTFCASGCSSTGGTYTPDAGTNRVIITVVAAGGGSGGCATTPASQSCVGGSAAGGSAARVLATTGFSGITMTVGAAGAAGASTPGAGGQGGTTSAGSLVSCPGGIGGGAGGASAATVFSLVVGASGIPSACTVAGATTLVSMAGQGSGPGFTGGSTVSSQYPGQAGSSLLGAGVAGLSPSGAATAVGSAGTGYGWGAGGSVNSASQAATGGLAGGPSLIIVEEYN